MPNQPKAKPIEGIQKEIKQVGVKRKPTGNPAIDFADEIATFHKADIPSYKNSVVVNNDTHIPPDEPYSQARLHKHLWEDIVSREGIKKNKEGKHIVYRDTKGNLTGGHGHLLNPKDPFEAKFYKEGAVVPDNVVDAWRYLDTKRTVGELQKLFPNQSKLPVTARLILADMVFNMGAPAVKKFKNFAKAANKGDFDGMAYEIINSDYYPDTKTRAWSHALALEHLHHKKTGGYTGVRVNSKTPPHLKHNWEVFREAADSRAVDMMTEMLPNSVDYKDYIRRYHRKRVNPVYSERRTKNLENTWSSELKKASNLSLSEKQRQAAKARASEIYKELKSKGRFYFKDYSAAYE